ncbi:MAG: hypothetical protein LBN26_09960 [Christensenellaceae bacterium]|nr:hypothetical protein [Christensenellaceae bacterium]
MSKATKQIRAVLCTCFAVIMALAGCSSDITIKPSATEISKISSSAGFLAARVEENEGFIANSDKKEKGSNYAYLYDNAVAMIALSGVGADWHAQKIADAIVFAQGHDRTFDDGRLRNAYVSGDPKSDSGRSIIARKVTIQLPGFWQDGRWQEDSYTVSTSTGNMAWTILALCAAAKNAPADKRDEYIEAAARAADFILMLKSSNGGFTAGYEGWDDAQVKVTYKSTEHNIALICAFSAVADAVAEKDPPKSAVYREASEYAKTFVLSMYDKKLSCFYTGTEEDGETISKGVIPLDANALTILALAGELENVYGILSFVENRMSVGDGFDFSAGDLDGIWNEGTAQMAVCYSLLGDTEKYEIIIQYLKTQAGKDGSIPAADRDGVSTGFVVTGSDVLWEYHNSQSIAATSWYAFARMKINPFQLIAE